ncbi:MAG TPA: saccharopine dehydrogenase C-terminal domain-containing protein [Chitinophagaceae bacterium]|nr:saccharopine dehydrogenase C-terminal domain-containing protein [Chitinophagaceae bacterium]
MKSVLVIGAGKSSTYLIDYLINNSKNLWRVTVMDTDIRAISEKIKGSPKVEAAVVSVDNDKERRALVKNADLVISLLPPRFHHIVGKDCLEFKKHLITASYVTPELMALHNEAKEADLMFMCEMGLDPGIDHMSAMQLFNGIYKIAGEVKSFKSYCGGLVAPESDDNPWHYKMTWNGKNIINAGKLGGKWIENGKIKELSYEDLFSKSRNIKFSNLGTYGSYPNRDSVIYKNLYELDEVETFIRSTIRPQSFMRAWKILIEADLTNELDSFDMSETTYADWLSEKTGLENDDNLRAAFQEKYNVDAKDMKMFDWIRIFENRPIYLEGKKSSAEILQDVFESRLQLNSQDKDMILMQHEVEYERRGKMYKISASLKVKGENKLYSAMAKTVGLPMALFAERILTDKFEPTSIPGVQIPIMPEVYAPILKELEKEGIEFIEEIH